MKSNKIDLIFIIGIICLGMTGALMDIISGVNFPIYCLKTMLIEYILWYVLIIYSSIAYKEKNEKPQYVNGCSFFLLPFFHIVIFLIGTIIFSNVLHFFENI